jgi:hypothetical protein
MGVMGGLGSLTPGELLQAESASKWLMGLYNRNAITPELHTKLSTLHADVTALIEDHEATARRARLAYAARGSDGD